MLDLICWKWCLEVDQHVLWFLTKKTFVMQETFWETGASAEIISVCSCSVCVCGGGVTVFQEKTQESASLSTTLTPHSSPGYTPTWPCLPAPGRWWWSKPQICWQRRRGTPQSRPHKRWMSPCGSQGWGPGPRKWHPQSASGPWKEGKDGLTRNSNSHIEITVKCWIM